MKRSNLIFIKCVLRNAFRNQLGELDCIIVTQLLQFCHIAGYFFQFIKFSGHFVLIICPVEQYDTSAFCMSGLQITFLPKCIVLFSLLPFSNLLPYSSCDNSLVKFRLHIVFVRIHIPIYIYIYIMFGLHKLKNLLSLVYLPQFLLNYYFSIGIRMYLSSW